MKQRSFASAGNLPDCDHYRAEVIALDMAQRMEETPLTREEAGVVVNRLDAAVRLSAGSGPFFSPRISPEALHAHAVSTQQVASQPGVSISVRPGNRNNWDSITWGSVLVLILAVVLVLANAGPAIFDGLFR